MTRNNRTVLGRWDKDVLCQAKEVMPKETTATISRMLWQESRWFKAFMKKKERGSIQDVAYLVAIMFGIGLIVLIGFKFNSSFNDQVQASTVITSEAKTAVDDLTNVYTGTMDGMFLFTIIGLCLASIILAALVRVHPIFLVFYLLSLVFVILVGGIASNVYTSIASDPNFSSEASQLVMISFVMTKLPFLAGVFGAILAVITYKTWRNSLE